MQEAVWQQMCIRDRRYSDFISLSPDNIVEIRQETWLIYKSIKTSTEVRLPLYLLFCLLYTSVIGKGTACLLGYNGTYRQRSDYYFLRPTFHLYDLQELSLIHILIVIVF